MPLRSELSLIRHRVTDETQERAFDNLRKLKKKVLHQSTRNIQGEIKTVTITSQTLLYQKARLQVFHRVYQQTQSERSQSYLPLPH